MVVSKFYKSSEKCRRNQEYDKKKKTKIRNRIGLQKRDELLKVGYEDISSKSD